MQVLHAAETARRIEGVRNFAERLVLTELAFVDVTRPSHQFAGRLFAVAAEPTSPLNPFSPESAPAGETSTGIFRDVVAGADVRGDARVLPAARAALARPHGGRAALGARPRSRPAPDCRARPPRRAVPLVDRLIRLSRLRPLRPLAHEVLDLARDVRAPICPTHRVGFDRGTGRVAHWRGADLAGSAPATTARRRS
jgi:hypothetical protein